MHLRRSTEVLIALLCCLSYFLVHSYPFLETRGVIRGFSFVLGDGSTNNRANCPCNGLPKQNDDELNKVQTFMLLSTCCMKNSSLHSSNGIERAEKKTVQKRMILKGIGITSSVRLLFVIVLYSVCGFVRRSVCSSWRASSCKYVRR